LDSPSGRKVNISGFAAGAHRSEQPLRRQAVPGRLPLKSHSCKYGQK